MAPSLNTLHGFVAVARRLSFSEAARDLGVSASALSQAVRRLEEEVGVVLLHRTSRSVTLTDAGRRLLAEAGPALDEALDALVDVTARPGEITGRVRLSVPGLAAELVLREILVRFAARHPNVEVDVRVENAFVDIVQAGLDAGVRLVSAIDRDMVHVRLHGPCRVVVVGAPSYLTRRGIPERLEDLTDHACLGMRFSVGGAPFVWELGEGDQAARVPVTGPVVTNDPRFLRQLALRGTGLLYTVEEAVSEELARGELQVVLEPFAQQLSGLFLYFPGRAQVSPALRAFIDLAREVVGRS